MYLIVAYQMNEHNEATDAALCSIVEHSNEDVSAAFVQISESPIFEHQLLRAIPVQLGKVSIERIFPFFYSEEDEEDCEDAC